MPDVPPNSREKGDAPSGVATETRPNAAKPFGHGRDGNADRRMRPFEAQPFTEAFVDEGQGVVGEARGRVAFAVRHDRDDEAPRGDEP